jgi:class 3 adenylate cyclase/predicted ATPase
MGEPAKTLLETLGLGQYAQVFADNDIDLVVVWELTDDDLKGLGMSLGHRKKLLRAIAAATPSRTEPTQGRTGKAERRQLTIMFCDLADSTSLSVRFDPEDLRAITKQYQDCCESLIQKYGGKVARYMGDGLLVYFGYPEASEHDPENAVRAGREIASAIPKLAARGDVQLHVRVGIATGPVVVGDLIGRGAATEQAVVGETPNLAKRLQEVAPPDTVAIAKETRRLVGDLFECVHLGVHSLKGFDAPVPVWSVGRETFVESRFQALRAQFKLSKLVGRDREVEQLLELWQQAVRGKGHAVAISGEAGIGKSRLTLQLRELIEGTPHTLLIYSCAPHYQQSALLPVINHLERAAGFDSGDSAEARLDKLEAMLARRSLEVHAYAPLYASLLGLPIEPRYAPLALSPRMLKEKTFLALEEQLASIAREGPVLLVFEDLHWVDPTTLELLDRTVRRVAGLPILMIITARPSFHASWLYQHCTTIHLSRLSHAEAATVVVDVTAGNTLPVETVERILDRADGIPLYLEELTRTMIESGRLRALDDRAEPANGAPELAIPSTLRDSLTARLDRLGSAKEVAEVGAVIGRQFSYELLAAVVPQKPEQLREALDRLTDSGLVDCSGAPPHSTYSFRHALIQDAAYGGLLLTERRSLHGRIAEALARDYEALNVRPELLAYHHTKAGEAPQAIARWQEAAGQARERGAHVEAIRHIKTALQLTDTLSDDDERVRLQLELRVALGINLEATGGYAAPEVAQNYARARALCDQLGYTTETVPVLLGLFVFHLVSGDFEIARDLAEQCMHFSERANRIDYLIESCAALGHVLPHLGDLERSVPLLQRCVQLSKDHPDQRLSKPITAQDPAILSFGQLGIVSWMLGAPDEALQHIDAASARGTTLLPIDKAIIYPYAAAVHQLRGEPTKALEYASKGVRVATEHGYDYWSLLSLSHLGIAQAFCGQPSEGAAAAARGIAGLRAAGANANLSYFSCASAEVALLANDLPTAQRLIDEAFEMAERTHEHFFLALLHCVRGAIREASADLGDAESEFLAAVEFAKKQGARSAELRALIRLHRLRLRQAEPAQLRQSREMLAQAYASFESGFTTSDLVAAKALLEQPT